VDDDFSGNPINGMDGGVAGNVLDNDLLNDDPVDAGDITISVVSDELDLLNQMCYHRQNPIARYRMRTN
jgi:hypothetical protein